MWDISDSAVKFVEGYIVLIVGLLKLVAFILAIR
jgi:hypothetical protein